MSQLIRVNQTGYSPDLPQYVTVLSDTPVILTDDKGVVLHRFEGVELKPDAASGENVALLELGLSAPGTYCLEAAGQKQRVTVQKEPWRAVTNALIKGLFFQRCGCELKKEFAGAYAHRACHTALAVDWDDNSVSCRITGGWHDAGDYGKYTGPGAVTVGHLLYAWKLFGPGCSDELNIPESGNGVPDILNEARYELEWLLQMQGNDGAFHHKLSKARFAPFIMPENDHETEYLMPVSHCATADACACLALASRVYREVDRSFANRMLLAALRAWEWLQKHPDFVPFRNPEGVSTGWYGDRSDTDERFWAACELFAATHEERFRQDAEVLFKSGQNLTRFGWSDVGGMGALCCLFDLKEEAGSVLYDRMKADFVNQSREALRLSQNSGYGTALAPERYVWGSILPILSNAMAMILCCLLTGQEEMRDAALMQWHYALGMNALDKCFVTGFGEYRVLHPHHRPSGSDGIDEPVPGLISGGPNKCFPYPSTRQKLGEDVPPAKYYLDETPSADTNEIAIYWNSPAVFIGAYFNMLTQTISGR